MKNLNPISKLLILCIATEFIPQEEQEDLVVKIDEFTQLESMWQKATSQDDYQIDKVEVRNQKQRRVETPPCRDFIEAEDPTVEPVYQ